MHFPFSKTLLKLLLGSITITSISASETGITHLAYRSTNNNFGSLHIINSCHHPLKARSVGAYSTNSSRNASEFPLPAGTYHREPFRETIPISKTEAKQMVTTHVAPIDAATGKIKGQGISFMITTPSNTDWGHDITQIEYSLIQNPENNDTFKRLWYDISLLNCAAPTGEVTDMQASKDLALNRKKVKGCPGYQNGIALWTSDSENCRPLYCDGVQYCESIYDYDKTKLNEASLACTEEYSGDLFVELCAGNGNGTSYETYEKWRTEGNVTNVIVPQKPGLNISTKSSVGGLNTSASSGVNVLNISPSSSVSVRFPNSTVFQPKGCSPTLEPTPFESSFLDSPGTQVTPHPTSLPEDVSPSDLTTDAQNNIFCTSDATAATVECWSKTESGAVSTPFPDSTVPSLVTVESSTAVPSISGPSTLESNIVPTPPPSDDVAVNAVSSQEATMSLDTRQTGFNTGSPGPMTGFVWPSARIKSTATESTEQETVNTVLVTEYSTITCHLSSISGAAVVSGSGCGSVSTG